MDTLQKTFSFSPSFRIDVLCVNDTDCIDIETTECEISKPDWFQNNGEGFILVGKNEEETIHIKVHKKCKLRIGFKGPDIRIKNTRIPIQVVYKTITIDDNKLNDNPILCSYELPYTYNLDCDQVGEIAIKIVQEPYSYTKEEFLNGLMVINSKYIEERFDDFISDFKSSTQLNKIENFWKYRTQMLKLDASKQSDALHKYYAYLDNRNSWIAHNAKIISEQIFPHGISGIFISGGAKIGRNCVIFQQVTIGSNTLSDSSSRGAPTIGDNVYIGAGAKIIGKVTIGNNVRIGANAVVVTDVPDNSVVVMNKPRVIRKENMDNKFYHIINGIYGYHLDGKFFPVDK